MKRLRLLYTLTVVLWIVGITMTFCSTVKSIGKETIFYEKRVIYRVVGPAILAAGVVSLLVTEGLKMNFKLGEGGRKQPHFYIIQTSSGKKRKTNTQSTANVKADKDIICKTKKRKLFQLSPDMECVSIENIDIDIQPPGDTKSSTTESNESEIMKISTESQGTIPVTQTCNSQSPKRTRDDWKRFHWTKLSQESANSAEFSVIDENEALQSSVDSANFRQQSRGPPRSPGGTFENPLARQWSTNSRASTTSKYSNFSDDAPLIKR